MGGGTEANLLQSVCSRGQELQRDPYTGSQWALRAASKTGGPTSLGRWAPEMLGDFSKVTQPIFLSGKNIPYSC